MKIIVLVLYIVLMAGFMFGALWSFRHTVQFGYTSRGFKKLAWVFGIVSVALVIFSVYLILNYLSSATPSFSMPSVPKVGSGKINY